MATDRDPAPEAGEIEAAMSALRSGEAIIVPTDTVYGLAALPSVPGATARIWALKGRHEDRPLAVLVSDVEQGRSLLDVPPRHRGAVDGWVRSFWPGPLTIVGPRSEAARDLELGPGASSTIGVRCPADPTVRALARRAGPIAATSANRSGEPPEVTAPAAAASLLGSVAVVVDGGPGGTVPSTVVDITGETPRILRHGAIEAAALGLVGDAGTASGRVSDGDPPAAGGGVAEDPEPGPGTPR